MGTASKNPPPLRGAGAAGEVTCGAAGVDFWLEKLPRFEKGEGFGCCCACGDVVDGKPRPLKASVRPPNEDCRRWAWAGGDDISPNDGLRPCCGDWGCGLGAEAYSERIDCFRSGLEGPVELSGLEDALEGRPELVG